LLLPHNNLPTAAPIKTHSIGAPHPKNLHLIPHILAQKNEKKRSLKAIFSQSLLFFSSPPPKNTTKITPKQKHTPTDLSLLACVCR